MQKWRCRATFEYYEGHDRFKKQFDDLMAARILACEEPGLFKQEQAVVSRLNRYKIALFAAIDAFETHRDLLRFSNLTQLVEDGVDIVGIKNAMCKILNEYYVELFELKALGFKNIGIEMEDFSNRGHR